MRRAYEIDNAIGYPCPRCEAPPGHYCHRAGVELKIACSPRYALARQSEHQKLIDRANRRTHHQGDNNG